MRSLLFYLSCTFCAHFVNCYEHQEYLSDLNSMEFYNATNYAKIKILERLENAIFHVIHEMPDFIGNALAENLEETRSRANKLLTQGWSTNLAWVANLYSGKKLQYYTNLLARAFVSQPGGHEFKSRSLHLKPS